MPRVDSAPARSKNAPPRPRGSSGAGRSKKPQRQQDRLSQRTLVWRRVKRNLRSGLWVLGVGAVIVVGVELVRSLPSPPPLQTHKAVPVAAVPSQSVQQPTTGDMLPVMQPGLLSNMLAGLGFRVQNIELKGLSATDPVALAKAIIVKRGDPIFGFSLRAIQQRVMSLGPVQQVTIERVLPSTLVVDITERNVYAIWQTIENGHPVFQLIDQKGDVIGGQDVGLAKRREPSLLLLSGAGAPQQAPTLIPALKAVPIVMSRVAAAEWVDGLRWNLILKDHTVVKLPDTNLEAALGQLAALQVSMQLLDRPVEAIDLRQPGRLVVQPYVVAPTDKDKEKNNHADKHQEGQ